MGRKLKVTVYLDNAVEEGGQPKALLAGTEPSAEDAAHISNPDVWETDEEGTSGTTPAPRPDPATARGSKAGRRAASSED